MPLDPTSRAALAANAPAPWVNPKAYWPRLLGICAVVSLFTFVHFGGVLAMTPSIKYRLLHEAPGEPHKGDYAYVEIFNPIIDAQRPVKLTKRVACTAGEQLTFRGGWHFCGEQALGRVLAQTKQGQSLAPFLWNGPIPPGMVFLAGDHERSFDSRYFGFVRADALKRLEPLF